MSNFEESLKYAAEIIKQHYGERPKEPIIIYTTLDHVSRSGMMRKISAFIMIDNSPICIAREVKITGCGMDMGFHLAYEIFHTAYEYGKPKYQSYLDHRWL